MPPAVKRRAANTDFMTRLRGRFWKAADEMDGWARGDGCYKHGNIEGGHGGSGAGEAGGVGGGIGPLGYG